MLLGTLVGTPDGWLDGRFVKLPVGCSAPLGLLVGSPDGCPEGSLVGTLPVVIVNSDSDMKS